MVIEDRTRVVDGVGLIARYKDREHKAVAVLGEDGKLGFKVEGSDVLHTSLSTAAIAVAPEAKAINGWRFWTIEGDPLPERKAKVAKEKVAKAPREKKEKADRKPTTSAVTRQARPNITKMRKQTIEGQTGFFCSACMDGFYLPGTPNIAAECPKGHPRKMADDLAPISESGDQTPSENLDDLMDAPTEAEAEPLEI